MPYKSHVGVDAGPPFHHNFETSLIRFVVFVHDVCDQKRSGTRNTRCTVDQHVAFLPLLLDKPKHGEEGVADLLLLVVFEVELVVVDAAGENYA